MPASEGLVGLRPAPQAVERVVAPPYDVIKPGSELEALLRDREDSIYHVILGDDPTGTLSRLEAEGALLADDVPAYYVYEQRWVGGSRTGVLAAIEVADYATGKVRRHEKTFDDKVAGRIRLAEATGHTLGPVFLLTREPLGALLADAIAETDPCYAFTTDLDGHTDLDGIANRIFRVESGSTWGEAIGAALAAEDCYIADGHHRYHAALRGGQSHCLAYVTDEAAILAYDRVVRGTVPLAEAADGLDLRPADTFATPPPRTFCLYHAGRAWHLDAREVPDDVVGRLDCSILERELYPHLGLTHDMITDPAHFDFYSERELGTMRALVDDGTYDCAIALHPVATAELMAVADAGLEDPEVVMPEKSTFFAPKILTGLFAYRHRPG